MRIVFMGTPRFAALILERLAEKFQVVGVFTSPDEVRGRGNKLVASEVKLTAQRLGIPVETFGSLKKEGALEALLSYEPDLVVVAAYGYLLPEAVLQAPRFGCVNVHASLLPAYRGAAPIERAILNGDARIGVSLMRMEKGMDTGDYCLQDSVANEGQACPVLFDELAELGAEMLSQALPLIEAGEVTWVKQDEACVTIASKIEKGELNPGQCDSAEVFLRKVQASSPAHPSKMIIGDKAVTLIEARKYAGADDSVSSTSSVVYFRKKLYVRAADGLVELVTIKPDGKNAMPAPSFAAGLRLNEDSRLDWMEYGIE